MALMRGSSRAGVAQDERCDFGGTLVIHGDRDLMVNPSGGKACAEAIPNARLVTLQGLRHQLDDQRAAEIAALILSHARAR